MIILGAGLSGCLAGALERDATIIEAGHAVSAAHKAVLRFREDKIGRALGIPFKKVRVQKAIWHAGESYEWCSPRHANLYAIKVLGVPAGRSILNLAPADRYMAPDDLHAQLAARCEGRIRWGMPVIAVTKDNVILRDAKAEVNVKLVRGKDEPILSTIPCPMLQELCGLKSNDVFQRSPIWVERWHIPGSEQYQTIYFPDPELSIYRATLAGELMILEGMGAFSTPSREVVLAAFGLKTYDIMEATQQKYGKILPLPDARRKQLLLELTMKFHVFSLGRFALWRNILMDDVYEDLAKIRSLIGLGTYDMLRLNS